ncbi:prephenate dehydratase [Campylobacter pinnipediorum]|uniref:Bifunctional chorismate mutase/prephenate dehydratase n=1 Tax=Campylobacter pinnipediorum subsp. pinnipediorum TaxID=1660067 RepID=A0AAX0L9Q2_9BACT|nr:prephenate dehydratase [Campylobacter pinnipediorum]AQW85057.1 chorismate mutase / prephenate dehydratase [Campylobacter pinnipediorum subsp. pinnipediorum]OPA76444.1 chorismate mutase [Campylobacter pinnipediorum subsp. pinnipediorum]
MQDIDDLRKDIDDIDDLILEKLNQRMKFVKKIGELKQTNGSPIYRPEREKAILNRLESYEDNLLNKSAIESIYLEIFAVSRNIEMPQKIAYLGPEGTYTYQAAESRFGAMSEYLALASIESVFTKLSQKEVKYGVVPIENNTEGAVGATFDCLAKFENVKIVSEIYLDIHHSFISLNENLKNIKTIYSHPQGYNQCRNFLESHMLSGVTFVAAKSTAHAAFLASKDKESAAICSKIAAKLYNVPIMFETIEDNMANRTRFFVLSDFKTNKTKHSKTSILAKTDHLPGSLADLLNLFKSENINLSKLESRPIKQSEFRSLFFIDFDGHIDDDRVQNVLKSCKKIGIEVTWLGSYLNGDDR